MEIKKNKVTICACASRSFIDKDKAAEIAGTLQHNGYDVSIEADLCRRAMTHSAEISEIATGVIIACYQRAMQSHLHRLKLESNQIIDMRNNSKEEVLSRFNIVISDMQELKDAADFRQEIRELPVEQGADAWYPVIDKTRCTECGKCHDFCLFGVYAVEDKKIKVVKPHNCKNNCPACARVCPGKAIIFPKYEKSPINGGTHIEETYNPEEMDKMYHERLRMKLQQRRAGVSLLKDNAQ